MDQPISKLSPQVAVDSDADSIDSHCHLYEQLWHSGSQPNLLDFLSQCGWTSHDVDQRLAVELACIDLEFRWRYADKLSTIINVPDKSCPLASQPSAANYATWLYARPIEPLPIEWLVTEYRLRSLARDDVGLQALKEKYQENSEVVTAFESVDSELDTKPRQVCDTKSSKSHGFEVRCPQCRQPVWVVVDADLSDIGCPMCGSSFNLVADVQETRAAETVTSIGAFELIERLGVGGFGSVWKARDTQLERTVAIKLPRRGELSPEQTQMFLREARAAAQLNHPNIVAIHEVGLHDDSLFLVTDFVRGVSLSELLSSDHRLTMQETARTCRTLAQALHHAHEHGVVHRDLKPANIMIDDQGDPFLMDFGLAKREVGDVTMTVEGQILGTPAYMSPEQARGEGDKADRRTDIYSLGAVLFEMICGEMPFRGSMQMLLRQVINDEPPAPSSLNRSVPLDLQTICLKCLEKEPSKRYQSADALADDLDCFLEGRPIQARRISALERRWRWCKRNPAVASLIGLAASLLIVVAAVASVGYIQTTNALLEKEQAAAQASSVSQFMTDLFIDSDPLGWATGDSFRFAPRREGESDLTSEQLLDRGAQRLKAQRVGDASTHAKLLDTISGVYWSRGAFRKALDSRQDALAIRLRELPDDEIAIAETTYRVADNLTWLGEYDQAEQQFEKALARLDRNAGKADSRVSSAKQGLAMLYTLTDRGEEAIELMRQVVAMQRQTAGPESQQVAIALSMLAAVLLNEEREEEARSAILEAFLIFEEHRDGSIDASQALNTFQRGHNALGVEDYRQAEELLGQSVEITKKLLGDSHAFVAWTKFDYGRALIGLDRNEEAISILEIALSDAERFVGESHPRLIEIRAQLAGLYQRLDRLDIAVETLRNVVVNAESRFGGESVTTAEYQSQLAEALSFQADHIGEAVLLAKRAYERIRSVDEPSAEKVVDSKQVFAQCLLADGRPREVIALLDESPTKSETRAEDSIVFPSRYTSIELLGRAFAQIGEQEKSRLFYEEGLHRAERKGYRKPGWAARFKTFLGRSAAARGEWEQAQLQLSEAEIVLKSVFGDQDIWTQEAAASLREVREKMKNTKRSVQAL